MSDAEYFINCIRKRKSYVFFDSWLTYLNTNPSKEDILRNVHGSIDEYKGYGYATQAFYAQESVEQIISDKVIPNSWGFAHD